MVADLGVPLGYTAVTFDDSLWRGRLWAHLDCLFVRLVDRNRGTGKQPATITLDLSDMKSIKQAASQI